MVYALQMTEARLEEIAFLELNTRKKITKRISVCWEKDLETTETNMITVNLNQERSAIDFE